MTVLSPFPTFYRVTNYSSLNPPAFSDTYVKATSNYSTYYPYDAVNPATSLVGGWAGWVSSLSSPTNQRFHIDLGSPDYIKRIYYENAHQSGANTNVGAKNFTLWGSNDVDAFDDLTWGTNVFTGGTPYDDDTHSESQYQPPSAVDGNTSTRWSNLGSGARPHYWAYDLGSGVTKKITEIRIWGNPNDIENWLFQGSNNNADWDTLYTGTSYILGGQWNNYSFPNTTSYRYYRVYISAPPVSNWASFYEIQAFENTGWTLINTGVNQFDQHVASDIEDPKYILVKSREAYRYYAIKIADNWGGDYMAMRRISLQVQQTVLTIPVAAKFLSHFDGADNGTVFIDECGHTATINGSPVTKTNIKKFGSASFYSPSAGNYVTFGSSVDFDLGTYDFTLACWVYTLDDGRWQSLISRRPSTAAAGWTFDINPSNKIRLACHIGGGWQDPFIVGTTSILKNGLHYVEVDRQGSDFYLFVDGNLEATVSNAGFIQNTGNALTIGSSSDGGEGSLYGHIDEAVLIRGALHTSGFVPPTMPYSVA